MFRSSTVTPPRLRLNAPRCANKIGCVFGAPQHMMLIPPQVKTPGSKIKMTLLASLALFLVYQVWRHSDKLSFEVVSQAGIIFGGHHNVGVSDSTLKSDEGGIPKKIWYKLGPKGLSDEMKEWTGSCIDQNPDYKYEFLTDKSAEEYVIQTFSTSRPDIVTVYTQLTIPILKADLVRYLLLYTEGGIWSDLDVSCEEGLPISEWIPEPYRASAAEAIDIIVGWEFDAGYSHYYFHEFATWIILAKPGSRHMLAVINDILDAVHESVAANEVASPNQLTPAMVGDIVDFTGPRRFTRSVLGSLDETLGYEVDWNDIENIVDPVLLDKVLILPGNAFANSSNNFEDLGESSVPVMVKHHYAGSWKNEFGGERVEKPESPESSELSDTKLGT